MQFDHIGIFVHSLEEGRGQLGKLLNVGDWSAAVDDDVLKISVQFGSDESGQRYELVAPAGKPNPIDGSLARKRNLLNHVAYRVVDLEAAMDQLRGQGAVPLGNPTAARALDGAQVVFFMTELGVIVELIEEISDER
jgi:methylmalonyl-CoA/ethylmalonyl-CoA epimerase